MFPTFVFNTHKASAHTIRTKLNFMNTPTTAQLVVVAAAKQASNNSQRRKPLSQKLSSFIRRENSFFSRRQHIKLVSAREPIHLTFFDATPSSHEWMNEVGNQARVACFPKVKWFFDCVACVIINSEESVALVHENENCNDFRFRKHLFSGAEQFPEDLQTSCWWGRRLHCCRAMGSGNLIFQLWTIKMVWTVILLLSPYA